MLQCFVCSPVPKVSGKKGATGQSFIRKEIITYRIGTLVGTDQPFETFWPHIASTDLVAAVNDCMYIIHIVLLR